MCQGGAQQIAELWNPARRDSAEAAFLATELPYAASAWANAAAAIDDYAAGYAQSHRSACAATRVAGDQSDEVLGLRMACLQRRRAELGSLVDLLARADAGVVENAARAVRSLVGLDSCDARRVVERRAPLPEDPAVRAELGAVEQELARARALHMAGKLDEARPLLESLRARGAALDYAPLAAEILFALVNARSEAGVDVSEELVFAGATKATAAGNPRLAARAALSYANLIAGEKPRQAEAMRWISQAEAILADLGDDADLAATIVEARGNVAHLAGEHGAAVAHFRQAFTMRGELAETSKVELAEAETGLGKALFSAGQYAESLVAYQHSLAVLEVELGALHPSLLPALTGLANLHDRMGSFDKALAMQQRSLKLREQAFGADSTRVADALINLSLHQRSLGELADSEKSLLRAMKIYEAAYGPDHRDVAIVAINLANVFRDQGRVDAAAAQAERAHDLMVKHLGPDHPSIANLLLLRAAIVCNQNRCAESIPHYQRALEIQSKALGENHPDLIYTLTNWATDHVSMRQFRQAMPLLERAIEINAMAPLDLPIVAETLFQLAQCKWGVGERKRALQLARRAHEAFTRVDPRATQRTGAWLAAHGGRR